MGLKRKKTPVVNSKTSSDMGIPQILFICLSFFQLLSTWKSKNDDYKADILESGQFVGEFIGTIFYHLAINALLYWGGFY